MIIYRLLATASHIYSQMKIYFRARHNRGGRNRDYK